MWNTSPPGRKPLPPRSPRSSSRAATGLRNHEVLGSGECEIGPGPAPLGTTFRRQRSGDTNGSSEGRLLMLATEIVAFHDARGVRSPLLNIRPHHRASP